MSIATLSEASILLASLQDILGNSLIKYVNYKYGNEGEFFSEELIQQTWIRVWMKSGQCHSKSRNGILRWVLKIAQNLGLNMLRDTRKLNEIVSLDECDSKTDDRFLDFESNHLEYIFVTPNESSFQRTVEDQAIFQETLARWTSKLTPRERKVFSLWLYNFPNKQISKIMRISESRVTQLLKQINKKKPA